MGHHFFPIISNYQSLPPCASMSLFITIHDGDVLPLVRQVDNFTHWVEQFDRNLQLLLIRVLRFRT